MFEKSCLEKIEDYLWEIPKSYRKAMKVPARVYATEGMIDDIVGDESLNQLVNVAQLPGIVGSALAMPDVHEGYGFPVGGVAAFDVNGGIISPGGIGYDINCGVRLLKSNLFFDDIKEKLKDLANQIARDVPSGVGRGGRFVLDPGEMDKVLEWGVERLVELGYASQNDLDHIESGGRLDSASAGKVSDHAKKRGRDQCGTLGAGNHFIEVGRADEIFEKDEASKLGIYKDQICVFIHTGSRGLGHQIATDYIKKMLKAADKYGIKLPDRELACAPYFSREGQDYWAAMCAGANFAWSNRQMITYYIREAWQRILGGENDLSIVYDVAHNIAKVEEHNVNGKKKKVVVHRKGATRAFENQPVIIPGTMGTSSFLLVGQKGSMDKTFGSSCHGAGRTMSRTRAKKTIDYNQLRKMLDERGIIIKAGSKKGLLEEAPAAYKDVDDVVNVVHQAGIAKKVVRFRPVVVVKG
ncbi:RtcB family protein [Patescibacteria group bacterium]|nr:RtcB family protein [Patescibacteria group bacterium]